jgi:hypothetical protein
MPFNQSGIGNDYQDLNTPTHTNLCFNSEPVHTQISFKSQLFGTYMAEMLLED